MTYSRIDFSSYCVMSIWFGCNSACTICMLSDLKKALPIPGWKTFRKIASDVAREGRFDNFILSGGEVTTMPALTEYVRFLASLGRFKKIQIQTNAMALADQSYLEHLIRSGVNEFFISVHGLPDVHDAITRRPGSFKEMEAALKNLSSFNVNVISNTVLTRSNHANFIDVIAYLAGNNVNEIQVWNFFPMERTDSRDLVVNISDFSHLVPDLVSIARKACKPIVFKSFPHCLPITPPGVLDSIFPATMLPDPFWRQFSECGFGKCVYREKGLCEDWRCWGLSSAYVLKFGDERDLLKALRTLKHA
ncbi:MAG: radical SAM protein [Syntrophales bacterium LBB04]|nr:radical SAM protein [Syntrophales bacterium LBB04]